jgi:hypothetical protein
MNDVDVVIGWSGIFRSARRWPLDALEGVGHSDGNEKKREAQMHRFDCWSRARRDAVKPWTAYEFSNVEVVAVRRHTLGRSW